MGDLHTRSPIQQTINTKEKEDCMRHLLRRIGFYLVALWASITLNFLIPRLVPGNPAQVLIARLQGRIDPRAEHAMEIAFGISHASMWRQYIEYLGNLAHGNLGISITYFPTPVATVIGQDLPWTLALMGTAVVISFVCGTLLGIIVAWRRGSRLDALLPPALTFLSAIPYFWLALIMLYLFGFVLNWFPLSGGHAGIRQPSRCPAFLLGDLPRSPFSPLPPLRSPPPASALSPPLADLPDPPPTSRA